MCGIYSSIADMAISPIMMTRAILFFKSEYVRIGVSFYCDSIDQMYDFETIVNVFGLHEISHQLILSRFFSKIWIAAGLLDDSPQSNFNSSIHGNNSQSGRYDKK